MAFARGELKLTIKNLLFPQFCVMCNSRLLTEDNGYFCPTCWESTPRVERPFCPVCGRPHPPLRGVASQSNFPCGDCVANAAKRPHTRIYAPMIYAEAMAEAIKLFKFRGKTRLAGPIAEVMEEGVAAEFDTVGVDLLMPVPLHRVRLRQRGFNQAQLLAEAVLPQFPSARLDDALKRIRPTQVQSRIKSEAARRANVKGAFALDSADHIKDKWVVLVDDVVTTAGTVMECARVLRKAGAARVDVLAAAIAVPHDTI